ncbi:MAG: hypothetical protein JW944_02015 [Deltaproteobacteria bacterium]|nr:hypothetical protein [Deltaproteobacteria bacterium]
MKNFLYVLTVSVCITLLALPAFCFDRNDLVQVVYNENDNEVAINLGDISGIDFTASNQVISDAGSVSLSQFVTISTWEDLSLAFFAGDNSTYNIWFATTKDTISGISTAGYTPFQSAATSLYTYFNTDGTDDGLFIGAAATSGTNSYDERMNSNSTAPGYYSGFNNTDTSFGEADLGALVTDGYVDMYLYHYTGVTLDKGPDTDTDYTCIIRVYSDGSTVLNPPITVNHAPTISGAPATSVNEDSAYSFTPTSNDIDGDPLTFSITNRPAWANFNNETGELSGTPSNSHVGTTTGIVISVTDENSDPVSLPAFSITVANVNDLPTISGSPDTSVNEDSAYSFIPIASDIDVGDKLTFSITNKPSWAEFNENTCELSGTPSNTNVGITTGIVISVTDGNSSPVSLPAFNLNVVNVNDAPTISGMPGTIAVQDEEYSFTPTASDVDIGDTLTFSITNKPSWAEFNEDTGELSGTPSISDIGTTTGVVISVTDGTVIASLAPFDLMVKASNNAPQISGTPLTSADEDADYNFTATASDADGDELIFSIENKPAWLTFTTTTTTCTLAGTPGVSDIGTTTGIVISVTDGLATASLPAFDLVVVHVNHAPVISEINGQTINIGNSFVSFDLDDYVSDSDHGDSELTWTFGGNIAMTISIDGDHVVTITSSDDVWYGAEDITFTAEDPDGAADSETATFTIQLTPPAPPSVNSPADGSEETENPPVLSVNNSTSAGGLTLNYDFELDGEETFSDPLAVAYDLPEGESITSWDISETYPELTLLENATYYWRARAYDIAESEWSNTASFFMNQENEAPCQPGLSSPSNNSSVSDLSPILEVTNSNDPDGDDIIYEFEVYDFQFTDNNNPGGSPVDTGSAEEDNDGATSWTLGSDLTEDTSYWWRARALDEHGVASEWIGPYKFTVNTTTNAPTMPTFSSPESGGEVTTLTPLLVVNNSTDADSDELTYIFQIDASSNFNSTGAGPLGEADVGEGSGDTTSWQTPALSENETYYWRVKSSDGVYESGWLTSYFVVNVENEAPAKPVLRYPEDGATMGTSGPTLKTFSADDPDGDEISYVFEICSGGECTSSDETVSLEWKVSGLKNNTEYTWSVKAIDENGMETESDPWTFTVVTNSTPTPPRLNNPVSGGSVYSGNPVVLSVKNSTDEDKDPLTYFFEVYAEDGGEADFANLIEAGPSEEGTLITEYQVQATLSEGATYYWRAQAYDGENYSSYTSTFNFIYSAEAPAYDVDVIKSEIIYASVIAALGDNETYDITVDDDESGIKGVTLLIPKGAISSNINITIGIATGTPSLPSGVAVAGNILNFGPEGTEFDVPVAIKIPYTQEYLTNLGLDDPNDLKLYTYSSLTGEWEILSPSSVDTEDMLVEYEVSHFSIFTFGTSITNESDEEKDSDGRSGLCFISTAGLHLQPWQAILSLSGFFTVLSVLICQGRRRNK